jgi:superkiller protein 3
MDERERSPEVEELLMRAANLAEMRMPLSALHLLERALTQAPNDAEVRTRYKQAKREVAKLEAEEHRLRRALMKTPDDPALWQQLASTLAELEREREAADCEKHAVDHDPTNAWRLWSYGHKLNNAGAFSEAIAAFDRLIELRPQLSEGWSCKGMVLTKMHRHEEALPFLRHAVELNPLDIGG